MRELSKEEAEKIFPADDDFGGGSSSGFLPPIAGVRDPSAIKQVTQDEYLKGLELKMRRGEEGEEKKGYKARQARRERAKLVEAIVADQLRHRDEDDVEEGGSESEEELEAFLPATEHGEKEGEREKEMRRGRVNKMVKDAKKRERKGEDGERGEEGRSGRGANACCLLQ